MKQSARILLVLLALVCGFASLRLPAWDRRRHPDMVVITGTVLDAGSMTPLPGVEVSWRSQRAASDNIGRYEIELPVGVREIAFSRPDRPRVRKVLIVRQSGSPVRQDVLLPVSRGTPQEVLALDRGSRVGRLGKDLDSDISADSTISLADEYGNDDQLLTLNIGKSRVHSPVWLNAATLAFGEEGLIQGDSRLPGVFQFQIDSKRIRQIAFGIDVNFLSKSPWKDMLAIADQKDLYVMDSLSNPASLRRVFGLDNNKGFLLSIAWAPDDRIYLTIDDPVQLDDRHYLSRSMIASVKADGTDFKPDWAFDLGIRTGVRRMWEARRSSSAASISTESGRRSGVEISSPERPGRWQNPPCVRSI
jgi:hypothetical protein